jgi:hypothetical protein
MLLKREKASPLKGETIASLWLPSEPKPDAREGEWMSKRNGDKARFNRRRKKKLLNRKRNRALWKALESGSAGATSAKSRTTEK